MYKSVLLGDKMRKMTQRKIPPDWYHQSLKVDFFQRLWHKRRFAEVTKLIEPTRGKILDVGCADGTFSKIILAKTAAEGLIGIDSDKNFIGWAKRHWHGRLKFKLGDAHCLPFKNSFFEAVFCLEVLEHVASPTKILSEIKRVLKKNGYAVFLVPSDSFLFRLIWFLWLNFYPRGWVWRETHLQTFRNNYLTKLCQRVGFRIEVDKKFNLGMLHLIKVRK